LEQVTSSSLESENDILPVPPEYKINIEKGILIATFIGGPIAGAILIAENFNRFGKETSARNTWVFTILGIVLFTITLFYTRILEILSPITLPFLYTGVISLCYYYFQDKLVKTHQANDGPIYTIDRSLLAAFIGLIIMAPIYFFAYRGIENIGSL